jgi:hypothetical protein
VQFNGLTARACWSEIRRERSQDVTCGGDNVSACDVVKGCRRVTPLSQSHSDVTDGLRACLTMRRVSNDQELWTLAQRESCPTVGDSGTLDHA